MVDVEPYICRICLSYHQFDNEKQAIRQHLDPSKEGFFSFLKWKDGRVVPPRYMKFLTKLHDLNIVRDGKTYSVLTGLEVVQRYPKKP